MNTTPNNPTPEAPEPGRAPDAHEDAATTPVTPADAQPTERMSEAPPAASTPAAPATADSPTITAAKSKTPILVAGGLGVAIIAGALGFGAGYITGDTTSDHHPVGVSRHGGDWHRMDGHGGPPPRFRGGPDGNGMPGPNGQGRPDFQGPRGQQPGGASTDAPGGQTPSPQPSAGQQSQPS